MSLRVQCEASDIYSIGRLEIVRPHARSDPKRLAELVFILSGSASLFVPNRKLERQHPGA